MPSNDSYIFSIRNLLNERDDKLMYYLKLLNQNAELERKFKNLSESVYIFKDALGKVDCLAEIIRLNNQCSNLREKIRIFNNDLSENEEDLNNKIHEISVLDEKLKNLQVQSDKIDEDYAKSQEEISEINNLCTLQQEEFESLNKECTRIESEFLEKTHKNSELKLRFIQVEKEVDTLEKRFRKKTPQIVTSNDVPRTVKNIIALNYECFSASFSNRGSKFVVAGKKKSLDIYRTVDMKLLECLEDGEIIKSSRSAVFSSNDQLILSCDDDNICRIWNMSKNGKFDIIKLESHSNAQYLTAIFDRDNVIMGKFNKEISIWNFSSQYCSNEISCESTPLNLSEKNGILYSGHMNGDLLAYDMRDLRKPIYKFKISDAKISSLNISPDENFLVTVGSTDDCLRLVDLRNKSIVQTYQHLDYKNQSIWAKSTISPDGNHIYSGSSDGAIYVWETKNGNCIEILKEHQSQVRYFSWNNKLNYRVCNLLTADINGNLKEWIK